VVAIEVEPKGDKTQEETSLEEACTKDSKENQRLGEGSPLSIDQRGIVKCNVVGAYTLYGNPIMQGWVD